MYVAVNDAVPYTLCLQPPRELILTAILLKISQISLKIMYIQKLDQRCHSQRMRACRKLLL